ncbi:MAG: hypothetical protein PHC50_06205 [Candidatus Cloacimonetes bacterium]|nr:hypothetical protein [Candidatus Cloacimonadota bacterium]
MAVKHYHVLAFEVSKQYQLAAGKLVYQPHYLGKTSDLSFNTEVDVSLELDDGTTEVGSEKLSLAFSSIMPLTNPAALSEVWLVPAIGHSGGWQQGEAPRGDILRVHFRDSEDYRLELKSGTFELLKFSATLRYPVDTPAYEYISDFWKNHRLHLLPHLEGDSVYPPAVYDKDKLLVHEGLREPDRLGQHTLAIVEYQTFQDKAYGPLMEEICPSERGIFLYPELKGSRYNLYRIYKQASAGYIEDLLTYAAYYARNYSPLAAFEIFCMMMHNFGKQHEGEVCLDAISIPDIRTQWIDLCYIGLAIDSGYLPDVRESADELQQEI